MEMNNSRKRKHREERSHSGKEAVSKESKKLNGDVPSGTASGASKLSISSKSKKRQKRREKEAAVPAEGNASGATSVRLDDQSRPMRSSPTPGLLAKRARKKQRTNEKRAAAKAAIARAKASTSAASGQNSVRSAASVTRLARPEVKVWHESISDSAGGSGISVRRSPFTMSGATVTRQAEFEIDWAAIEREAQKRLKTSDLNWNQLSAEQVARLEDYYVGARKVKQDVQQVEEKSNLGKEDAAEVKGETGRSGVASDDSESIEGDMGLEANEDPNPPEVPSGSSDSSDSSDDEAEEALIVKEGAGLFDAASTGSESERGVAEASMIELWPTASLSRDSLPPHHATQHSAPFKPFRERRLSGVPASTGAGNLESTAARFQRFSEMMNGSDSSDSSSASDEEDDEAEHQPEHAMKATGRGSIEESFADEMFARNPETAVVSSDDTPEPGTGFDKSAADEAAKQYESWMKSRQAAGSDAEMAEESSALSESDEEVDERSATDGSPMHAQVANDDIAMSGRSEHLVGRTGTPQGPPLDAVSSSHSADASGDPEQGPSESNEDDDRSLAGAEHESPQESSRNDDEPMPEAGSTQLLIQDDITRDGIENANESVIEAEPPQLAHQEQVLEQGENDLLDGLQRDIDAMTPSHEGEEESRAQDLDSIEYTPAPSEEETPLLHGSEPAAEVNAAKVPEAVTRDNHSELAEAETQLSAQRPDQLPSHIGIEVASPIEATAANVAVKKGSAIPEAGGLLSPSGHSPDQQAQANAESTTASGLKFHSVEDDRIREDIYSDVVDVTREVFGTTRDIYGSRHSRAVWQSDQDSILSDDSSEDDLDKLDGRVESAEGTDSDLPAEIRKAMAAATNSSPPASASKRKMTGMTSKHFSPAKRAKTIETAVEGAVKPVLDNIPIKTFESVPARIAYVDIGRRAKRADVPTSKSSDKISERIAYVDTGRQARTADDLGSTRLRNDEDVQWRETPDAGELVQQHMPDQTTASSHREADMPAKTRAQSSAQAPDRKGKQSIDANPHEDAQVDHTSAPPLPELPAEAAPARKKETPSKQTGTISEHFIEDRVDLYNTTAGKRRRVAAGESANPFPPTDKPYFGIIQERTWHEPFWLIIATVFLNKTTGRQAAPTFWKIRQRWPQPRQLAQADPVELFEMIAHLGLQNQRTKRILQLAAAWTANPPVKGHRTRKLNYPEKGDGKQWKKDEIVEEDADDCAGALEIAHIPGCGAYAYDSWRIFCRDVLRGVATDFNGKNAASPDFEPEWKRVLPADKELRACLRWMWLKEGWIWNPLTGEKRRATEEEMEKAAKGEIEVEDEDERKFAAQAAGVDVDSPGKSRRGDGDDALEETPGKTTMEILPGAEEYQNGTVDKGADWALQVSQPSQAQQSSAQDAAITTTTTATTTADSSTRQIRPKKRKRSVEDDHVPTATEEETTSPPAQKKRKRKSAEANVVTVAEAADEEEHAPPAKKAKKTSTVTRGEGSRRKTRYAARLVSCDGVGMNLLDED